MIFALLTQALITSCILYFSQMICILNFLMHTREKMLTNTPQSVEIKKIIYSNIQSSLDLPTRVRSWLTSNYLALETRWNSNFSYSSRRSNIDGIIGCIIHFFTHCIKYTASYIALYKLYHRRCTFLSFLFSDHLLCMSRCQPLSLFDGQQNVILIFLM